MTSPTALRDAGMDAATHAADPRLVLQIDRLIESFNVSGLEWSANDIRAGLPVSSQGLVGARVKAASMRKDSTMRAVGRTRSSLPNTHAKEITVWRGGAS